MVKAIARRGAEGNRCRYSICSVRVALGFAIEQTDSIATRVADQLLRRLMDQAPLRAARLGPQTSKLQAETALVSQALRDFADALERGASLWGGEGTRQRMREGLRAEAAEGDAVRLVTADTQRTLPVAADLKAVLVWASGRAPFLVEDVVREVRLSDPGLAAQCVSQLTRTGLLELV